VTGFTKAFGGIVALDNVDFAASPGEVHALLGENGAGKSTLIKALTGAICADAGEIRPDGAPITLHNPRQARRVNAAGIILTILTAGQNGPLIWVIPILIALAALVGLLNGVGIAVLCISPIIMTLGMNVIVEGALLVYMGGQQASKAPPLIVEWTFNTIGPVPINTPIWAGLALIAAVLLSWTTFGRRLYALVASRIVAEFSGVNVVPIMIATYVICSVAAAVAGILYTGFVAQPYLGMGDPYLFASVAAVAIGGTPLIGGSGHDSGTIAGALILTVLAGLLPILNLDPGALQIIYGVTILLTVAAAIMRFHGAAV